MRRPRGFQARLRRFIANCETTGTVDRLELMELVSACVDEIERIGAEQDARLEPLVQDARASIERLRNLLTP